MPGLADLFHLGYSEPRETVRRLRKAVNAVLSCDARYADTKIERHPVKGLNGEKEPPLNMRDAVERPGLTEGSRCGGHARATHEKRGMPRMPSGWVWTSYCLRRSTRWLHSKAPPNP